MLWKVDIGTTRHDSWISRRSARFYLLYALDVCQKSSTLDMKGLTGRHDDQNWDTIYRRTEAWAYGGSRLKSYRYSMRCRCLGSGTSTHGQLSNAASPIPNSGSNGLRRLSGFWTSTRTKWSRESCYTIPALVKIKCISALSSVTEFCYMRGNFGAWRHVLAWSSDLVSCEQRWIVEVSLLFHAVADWAWFRSETLLASYIEVWVCRKPASADRMQDVRR